MKFYITYGFGSNLRNCYSEVEAEDYDAARAKVEATCGQHFAFMYQEADYLECIDQYKLKLVPLQPQVK